MAWGICTPNSWYNLLDECMEMIQYFCDKCSEPDREVQVVASQIKSKFGSLRFYIDIYNANKLEEKIIYGFIDKAERRSYSCCEVCGKDGKPSRTNGWVNTLCTEHTTQPVDHNQT